ncbi:MAG: hypothetical protein ABL308_02225 [Oceanicaulis sp.]
MDQVEIDAVEAADGEEGFLLQLRPPAAPGADENELALRVEQFTRMFLKAAPAPFCRFAPIGPLTFAIAGPPEAAAEIESLRIDLAETLFGSDDPSRVRLMRGDTPEAPAAEPEPDDAPIEPIGAEDPWLRAQPSAASRAAFADGDAFDLDSGSLGIVDDEVVDLDVWARGDLETAEDEPEAEPVREARATFDGDWDSETWSVDPIPSGPAEPSIQDALDEIEAAFRAAETQTAQAPADPDIDEPTPGDASEEADPPVPQMPAAGPDGFDLRSFAADLDALEASPPLDPEDDDTADLAGEFGAEPAVEETGPVDDPLESLTEAPARGPSAHDLAAELAAFRKEIREIAGAIPGSGAEAVLSQFRTEIDEIAGAMGQRMDGAAQRVEAAADRIASEAAGRIDEAAGRSERSAELVERSVREAVAALTALLDSVKSGRPFDAAGPADGASEAAE